MPAGQPFTHLCRQLARGPRADRADLHAHSTCSDGAYSPAQLVGLARRCGLLALAITDHDTLAGVSDAMRVAAGSELTIVPGVEITAEQHGREVHLLAYFVRLDHAPLNEMLAAICRNRVDRYQAMVERLRACGVTLTANDLETMGTTASLGRRHLANVLVRAGKAGSVRDAFQRWLGDQGRATVPKERRSAADVLALVQGAGGVAALAHPPYDLTQCDFAELADLGLGAVEVEYPDMRPSWTRTLRGWATRLGLAISGGSDCHGPGRRTVGARTISSEELQRLRERCRND